MSHSIHICPDRPDVDAIYAMLSTSYWSMGIRREVLDRAFANSVFAVAIDDATGATVGVARVVTDRATFAWLCDVFVHQSHRGQGLATRMVQALHAHTDLQTLRRWCLATRDAHNVYAPLGYGLVPPDRWMERIMPKDAWSNVKDKSNP
jgi:GNAT superfamily N-acetyltransferase